MLVKLAIAIICGFVAYLIAQWVGLDHVLQLASALLVGVLVWVYGP